MADGLFTFFSPYHTLRLVHCFVHRRVLLRCTKDGNEFKWHVLSDFSLWSYYNTDEGPSVKPGFEPARVPGVQLPDHVRTRADYKRFLTPFSFFRFFFFTLDIVTHLCYFTNDYAKKHGPEKPDEMYRYFALLVYMAIVKAPGVDRYWSTAFLFHGLWARHFMSLMRFKATQSFIKACGEVGEMNICDKLCKVRLLLKYIQSKYKKLYQPYRNVAIDERMVINRGRYTFRQFIKDKPTR